MTPALARTRALLDTPPPDPIPGQLDLTRSDMTTYHIEFGKVGDTYPVPPLTLQFDEINAFYRAVGDHAIPHLRPVLTEMGRPELADCLFHMSKDRSVGQFLWLDLAAGKGARFCPVRLTVTEQAAPTP